MSTDTGHPAPARPQGRRPGASTTRKLILDAARTLFAKDGYAGTTIRRIAEDAGVDASLVMQFFGSKEQLFGAVMSITPNALSQMANAFDGPVESLGERVTRAYLGVWEGDPEDSEPLVALLRAAVSNEQASEQVREFIQARLLESGDSQIVDPDLVVRAGVASAMLVGVIVGRRIVQVPALVNEDLEALIARIAPAMQLILTHPPD
jgi:AcrR family transcriptional regulator